MPELPVLSSPLIVASDPLRLIVVRHGETALTGHVYNGCGAGAADPPLTESGRQRVRELGLPSITGPVGVATSPALRARQTCEELVAGRSIDVVDVHVVDALAEVDFGDWEGRTAAEVNSEDSDRWRGWLNDPAVAPPHGSSLAVRDASVRGYLDQLQQSNRRTWLLVGHASTVRLVVARVLDLPLVNVQRVGVGPGGWCDVRVWADGGASLDRLG